MGLMAIDNFTLLQPKQTPDGKGVVQQFVDDDTGQKYALMFEKAVAMQHAQAIAKAAGFEVVGKGMKDGPQGPTT